MALSTAQQTQLDYLVKLVSLRVDEYLEELLDESLPEAPVGDIPDELDKSARYILRRVRRPLAFFSAKRDAGLTVIENDEWDSAIIPLPNDYMRFIRVKMDGWKRPVNAYISDESRSYSQQIYPERRGTLTKPKAFLIPYHGASSTDTKQALEVFPYADGSIQDFVYVPYLNAYDLPEELEDAVVWKTVSVILLIMRQSGLAGDALTQMQMAIDNLNTGQIGEDTEAA